MEKDSVIDNISRHIRLDKAETEYFLSLLKPGFIKRKDFLLRANEICRYESFIVKGCLRTYTIDNNGLEHVVMFAMEDW